MSTIPDARVDRYYYIFDSRRRRAVVLDRTTGAEYDWDGEARVQLLRHVRDQYATRGDGDRAGARLLRRFAAWCARQTGIPEVAASAAEQTQTRRPSGAEEVLKKTPDHERTPGVPERRLWKAVQQLESGTPRSDSDADAARSATADAAMMALTVGLPRCDTDAARLLTVQAGTHADPLDAAVDAAHMSERWAEFADTDAPAAAARAMRQRQVDWLLDRLLASLEAV
jgi:hypothetical protein